jgi:hypothetical protein
VVIVVKIFLDKIDSLGMKSIGYTQLASFPTHFQSKTFEGWGRFVPGAEQLEDYINREIEVEIAQETVIDFRVSKNRVHKIEPLEEQFSYFVVGEVKHIAFHSEPVGNQTTYVESGDAVFTLNLSDIGSIRPNIGETVEFQVCGLSLWDESI